MKSWQVVLAWLLHEPHTEQQASRMRICLTATGAFWLALCFLSSFTWERANAWKSIGGIIVIVINAGVILGSSLSLLLFVEDLIRIKYLQAQEAHLRRVRLKIYFRIQTHIREFWSKNSKCSSVKIITVQDTLQLIPLKITPPLFMDVFSCTVVAALMFKSIHSGLLSCLFWL